VGSNLRRIVSLSSFSTAAQAAVLSMGLLSAATAQPRMQFPSEVTGTSGGAAIGALPVAGGLPVAPAQVAQSPATTPGLTGGIQPFDPYSTMPGGTTIPPTGSPTLPGPAPGGTMFNTPPGGFPPGTAPTGPPAFPGGPPVQYPYSQTPYGPGYNLANPFQGGYGSPLANASATTERYLRLIERVGMEYTWVEGLGGGPAEVDSNDVEVYAIFAFPNFLFSPQPLYVTPGFTFHFWEGPNFGPPPDPVLPPRAYDAYLDFGWSPQITPQFGAEVNFRVGMYTDFDTTTVESVRYTGTGLAVLHVAPTLVAKFGVVYLDRVDLKLLPAGGVVWTPNNMTYFDIYFPRPKLAQYLTTLGNTDVWWYMGAEYGGGSWTLDVNPDGVGTAEGKTGVDLNDIRTFVGLEWTHPNRMQGYVEVGYVFEREVVYNRATTFNFEPEDSVMLRAGVSF